MLSVLVNTFKRYYGALRIEREEAERGRGDRPRRGRGGKKEERQERREDEMILTVSIEEAEQ